MNAPVTGTRMQKIEAEEWRFGEQPPFFDTFSPADLFHGCNKTGTWAVVKQKLVAF